MLERKHIKTELCVIGGGMAGISAAVAAAREGIKVVLMHERPVLGGNASSEIRMWVCGANGKNNRETGLIEDILTKNAYYNPTKNPFIFDTMLLETVKAEENITLLLNCTCMDAKTETGEFPYGRSVKIKSVSGYQMTTQRFYDIEADFFADCSGDSILAPLTGAEFTSGRECAEDYGEQTLVSEPDSLTMGNSCLIQCTQTEHEVSYTAPESSLRLSDEYWLKREPHIHDPSENFWYLELGGNRDTIADSEEIGDELKSLALGMWAHIKENDQRYNSKNFALDFVGALPGKRESRRYIGEYVMRQQDISKATDFEDTVAFGGWTIDDHYPDGFYHKGHPNTNIFTDAPYPIPYRILYSKNVDNLYFAGRNISATHMALTSLRVMATCAVMGEAVGVAAATAVKNGLTPHGVYENKINDVQDILLQNDCFLPFKKRKIADACVEYARAHNMEALADGEDRQNHIYGDKECGIAVQNGTALVYEFEEPVNINTVHIVFNSDLDRDTLPGVWSERKTATRAVRLLSTKDIYVQKTLCRDFEFNIVYADGRKETREIKDSMTRCYNFDAAGDVIKLELIPKRNWGESDMTDVFSFDFR